MKLERPYEFTDAIYPDKHRWEYICHNLLWDNKLGSNDSNIQIAQMVMKNKHWNH